MKKTFINLIEKFKTSDQVFMIIIPVIIGLLGGIGAAALKFLIHFFQDLFWGNQAYSSSWFLTILIPAGGAFVVGMIIYFFSSEAKGHGVPEVMEAISLRNGIIRARVVFSKAIASSITIASGGSVGREGPIIQIGSAIGSSLGQLFKISRRRMQTLVGCGAAAGIAAAFNAPIAGAMFSVEILLGDFAISQFSPIVISSVTATVVSRAFFGNYPAFIVPKYELIHWLELIPYAVLGLVAGLVGILFVKVLYYFEDKFDEVKIPDFYKTAMGGILLGIIGLSFPQIFGVGYGAMNIALLGNMEIWLLLALIFMKILASSITLGSGSSGGIFAPSLFMGAMTGGLFGNILNKILPGMTAGPGAYALVAMSAVVAATTHAPITAILIIFEMTNDYKIILPLMIATIISLVVTKAGKGSIYTLKLMRKGINIHQGREINILKSMKVKDVMRNSIEIICPKTSINDLSNKFVQSEHNFFYIVDDENIIIEKISQTELAAIAPDYENLKDIVLATDIATPNHLVVTENDHLDYVMKEFAKENIGEIPVVSNDDPTNIIGTIWRIDVISAYNKEILKRDLAGEVSHLITGSASKRPVEVVEGLYLLELESPLKFKGKKINDLNIRNKYQVDIVLVKKPAASGKPFTKVPGGDYIFEENDIILILGEKEKVDFLSKL
ncbi:MAG: chloride channel protein [Acidobacteriota bacterium]